MRTFSKGDWDAAQEAWASGEFSDEWREVRHQAAMRGILYPPTGSRWDSWDVDEPSQRAILIRAIRETPELLERCLFRARSWSDVIAKLLVERDELREDGWRRTHRDEDDRDEPDPREATVAIKRILERIGNS